VNAANSGWLCEFDLMDGFRGVYFRGLGSSMRLPILALVVLLNRSPMVKMLVETNVSLIPRTAQIFKWLAGSSIVVGSVNSVTGATASVKLLEGYNNTTGYLGEYFRLSFASTSYKVGSYKLGGAAPPGLALSPVVNEFGVGTVDGIPTRAGVYNLDIWAYKEKNQTGDSTLLALTVYVLEKGPSISKQPQSASVPWGSMLNLTVALKQSNGAVFQWRKDGVDIPGATASSYQIDQAFSFDEGLYDVRITKDEILVTSAPASIAVVSSGMQVWKESQFPDPLDPVFTGSQDDPDRDGLINLVEYALGTDPLEPSTVQLPLVGREASILGDFIVYGLNKNPLASDISFSAEYSDKLVSADWIPVLNQQNGMLIVEDENSFKVKVPRETACFVRFKISDG
jgi:hypothetical protein